MSFWRIIFKFNRLNGHYLYPPFFLKTEAEERTPANPASIVFIVQIEIMSLDGSEKMYSQNQNYLGIDGGQFVFAP